MHDQNHTTNSIALMLAATPTVDREPTKTYHLMWKNAPCPNTDGIQD